MFSTFNSLVQAKFLTSGGALISLIVYHEKENYLKEKKMSRTFNSSAQA